MVHMFAKVLSALMCLRDRYVFGLMVGVIRFNRVITERNCGY